VPKMNARGTGYVHESESGRGILREKLSRESISAPSCGQTREERPPIHGMLTNPLRMA
jgi:hypothetical protein